MYFLVYFQILMNAISEMVVVSIFVQILMEAITVLAILVSF